MVDVKHQPILEDPLLNFHHLRDAALQGRLDFLEQFLGSLSESDLCYKNTGMHTYQPCPECRKINRISLESLLQARKQPQCGHCKSPIYMTGIIGEVNASGLMALVGKSPMPVVATFWAPQAKGSEQFASAYFQAAQYFAREAVFVRVNTQEHRLAPETYGIASLPTTLAFTGGFERARMAQPLQFEELGGWLQTVLVVNGTKNSA